MGVQNLKITPNGLFQKKHGKSVLLSRCDFKKERIVINSVPGSQSHDNVKLHLTNGVLQQELPRSKKAEVYIVRTDGFSCTREMVDAHGSLYFEGTSTHQHVLLWKSRPRCVMVIKKMGNVLFQEVSKCSSLDKADDEDLDVIMEPEVYNRAQEKFSHLSHRFYTFDEEEAPRLGEIVDFIVCIGGDGVLLHAAHLFKHAVPPVSTLAIFLFQGCLNYDVLLSFVEFKSAISDVIYGASDSAADTSLCKIPNCYSEGVLITLRMRLLCEIYRSNKADPDHIYECLNEVVVDRGASPYLTNLECHENGRLITNVQADGIMLATPTGSTAYSVAAGGSMVHPHVPAILVTPICPHSLTFRPVILPDYADVVLKVSDASRGNAWVSFDGRDRQVIERGDKLRVRMSPHPVPTVTRLDQTSDWFSSLERCFGWNERAQQQPIEIPKPNEDL